MSAEGDLNGISQAIGGLQEAAKQAQRNHEAVWGALSKMREDLTPVLTLERRITAMEADVDDWRRIKQRGIGVLILAGLAGTALGAGIGNSIGAVLRKLGVLS